jgi:hypothetical protein
MVSLLGRHALCVVVLWWGWRWLLLLWLLLLLLVDIQKQALSWAAATDMTDTKLREVTGENTSTMTVLQ